MPALTIVAAWMSADTGVGASIASGSQVWNGNCADFAAARPETKRHHRQDTGRELSIVGKQVGDLITAKIGVTDQRTRQQTDTTDLRNNEGLDRLPQPWDRRYKMRSDLTNKEP